MGTLQVHRRFTQISVCGLLALLTIFTNSARFGVNFTDAQQIPFLKSYLHPRLYPGDPMVLTKIHYGSIYLMLLAAANHLVGNLALVYFVAHTISLTIIYFLMYRIGLQLTRSVSAAVFATLLSAGHLPGFFGFEHIWRSPQWTHSPNTPAVAAVLFAFYLFLRGRKTAGYWVAGLAAWLHSLSVLHFMLLWIPYDLVTQLDGKKKGERPTWFCALSGPLSFVILCLPLLFWTLNGSGETPDPFWLSIFRSVSWFDSFPSLWQLSTLLNFSATVLLGVVALSSDEVNPRLRRLGFSFLAGALLLSAIGYYGSDLSPNRWLIILQLTRATRWLAALLFFPIAIFILKLWREGFTSRVSAALLVVAILFVPYSSIFHLSVSTPLIPLALMIWSAGRLWKSRASRGAAITLICSSVLLLAYLRFSSWPSSPRDFLDYVRYLPGSWSRHPELLSLALPFFVSLRRWKRLAPIALLLALWPAYASYTEFRYRDNERGWRDVQLWARSHTRTQDVFVTPPWLFGFRNFSERSTFLEWRDGTQQYFSKSYGTTFRLRLNQLGFSLDPPMERQSHAPYYEVTVQRLKFLSSQYGVRYFVVQKEPGESSRKTILSLENQKVYENPYYAVFEIR